MDILDETTEFIELREKKRPVFLTVLCILTWVGSGIGLFYGLILLWSYAMFNGLFKSLKTSNVADANSAFAFVFWLAMGVLAGSIICALAAVLMFRQKKVGYYIYIFGQVIPIIITFFSFLSISNGSNNDGFPIVMTVLSMIFPVAFIIMYGVNLKHMNK